MHTQELVEIYRFVGRLEQRLVTLSLAEPDSDLVSRIESLQDEIDKIRSVLDSEAEQRRLDDSLQRITREISHYAEILGLERYDDPARLDIKELTLRLSDGARDDFLWEIGSGKNYMGFHVSTLISLHLRFAEIDNCPVPSFLVFDQPSQVFFPERWPEDVHPDDDEQKLLSNEEIENVPEIGEVHRIFRAMNEAVKVGKGEVQIIVTDHAGKITWQGLENVHLVEEWRGDTDFLIPKEWLD